MHLRGLPLAFLVAGQVALLLLLLAVAPAPVVASKAAAKAPAEQPPVVGPGRRPVPPRTFRDEPLCVVGAGPGGLQTAYFLKALGVPYVVFDDAPGVGAFFRKFPRQRQLISINKRFTGSDDAEFNLRHDWNSLLSHFDDVTGIAAQSSAHLFRDYDTHYYPSADRLVEYLEDFANRTRLNIRLGRRVVAIHRFENGTFRLAHDATTAPAKKGGGSKATAAGGATMEFQRCTGVVWAAGQGVLRRFSEKATKGAGLVTYYDALPKDMAADYENKDVLVIGGGNAALEVVRALEDHAASVHVYMRRGMQMAHQTHYVGHARAVNLGILDRYQLKSLDLLLKGMPDAAKAAFSRNKTTGRIHVRFPMPKDQQGDAADAAAFEGLPEEELAALRKEDALRAEVNALRRGYHHVIACLGFHSDPSAFARSHQLHAEFLNKECGSARDDETQQCRAEQSRKMAPVTPAFHDKRRHPVVGSNFESVNVPDFFVAGNLMHSRDWKRSSGGFIHGFRYLCRTLALQLRERYVGDEPYPAQALPPCRLVTSPKHKKKTTPKSASSATPPRPSCTTVAMDFALARLGNVSSLYQMQGQLADVILIDRSHHEETADVEGEVGATVRLAVLRDIPLDQASSPYPAWVGPRRLAGTREFLTVSLEFGENFQGLGTIHHQGQTELPSRTAEKMGWHADDDPDRHLGQQQYRPKRAGDLASSGMPMATGAGTGYAQEMHAPLHDVPDPRWARKDGEPDTAAQLRRRRERVRRMQAAGMAEHASVRHDDVDAGDDDDTSSDDHLLGVDRHREQFLHPVVRHWRRADTPPGAQAELVTQFRMREEVLNEWSLPRSHVRPLEAYLAKHVFAANTQKKRRLRGERDEL